MQETKKGANEKPAYILYIVSYAKPYGVNKKSSSNYT